MMLDDTWLPFPAGASAVSGPDRARLRLAFVNNYAGIWRFLRRMGVAEAKVDDAAQEVFLVALQALPRIILGSERAFLYGTAVRIAHGVRRKVDREVTGLDVDLDPSHLPSPEDLANQKRAREILDGLLDEMDLDMRTVFVLFELDGFTAPQIAELLSIPLGTAASRLRRARDRFQELVRAYMGATKRAGR